MKKGLFGLLLGTALLFNSNAFCQDIKNSSGDNYKTVRNKKGPLLGYSPASGVKIITAKGLYFKDLNRNGKLDRYEDWRLSALERAKDLAGKMSNEQIAGLMLYGDHQELEDEKLSKTQEKFIKDNYLRHILIDHVKSTEIAVLWNNNVQALCESLDLGIPLNNSSDPRHSKAASVGINGGAGGKVSKWPEGLAMAAAFDPALVEQFGHIAAIEFRAMGIATALSPQIDLGTEPRWFRISGTFGEDPLLTTDLGRAYIDGFQTSYGKDEIKDGWGYASVNAMVKHWPGGGPVESGRDAHFHFGKYAVYPGNNFETHLQPFLNGAFKLQGKTKKASAVMPYYTIAYLQDSKYGENVGNNFSKYIITDLLREKYGYDGVVCTDWHVTGGRKWGVEKLSTAERHYKILQAGVDQIGGVNEIKSMLEAFQMGIKEYGDQVMRQRIERSAVRLLCNFFRVGLFENPYLDVNESVKKVGCEEFVNAGYAAQVKSVILLKNNQYVLPLRKGITIYIPKIFTPAGKDPMGTLIPEKFDYQTDMEIVKKYFAVTDNPEKADAAIVFVKGPDTGLGYNKGEREYLPISLQYNTYKAEGARTQSIASEDLSNPASTNRSYKGKSITANNINDLKAILDTRKVMGTKPVIVALTLAGPAIVSEFEEQVQSIVADFGIDDKAILDILSGEAQPSGLLPLQMPANMKTVEDQKEDVPHDMECHIDSDGHAYDFGFGLNWKGVINDSRTSKYKKAGK